jgi:hypothetical protein
MQSIARPAGNDDTPRDAGSLVIMLPETPDRRPVNPDCIPAELQERPQWVGWSVTTIVTGKGRNRTERLTKTPIDVKRGSARADVTDPADHNPFDAVLANSQRFKFYGIGFVVTTNDPYVGIDLDKCRDPETGVIEPWALAIVEAFATYTELSPSGTGVHIIGRGSIPGDRNRTGQIEMYDRGRFFTFTGQPLEGYEQITDCQDALDTFYAETFPTKPTTPRLATSTVLSLDDREIIDAAQRINPKFTGLFDAGETSGYPSHSEARSALVYLLAGYSKDPAQLERLFQASALYREDKWPREGQKLINDALRDVTWQYESPRARAPQTAPSAVSAASQPTNQATDSDEFVGSTDGRQCVAELGRIAELEQALAGRDEKLTRLQERVRNQDDELHRLRRIASIQSQVLANKDMADGPKLALLAIAPEITSVKSGSGAPLNPSTPDPRIDGNAIHIDCTAVAVKMGCSPDVAGRRITKLVEAGLFAKRYRPKIIRNDETGQLMNGGKELLLVTQHDTLETILKAGATAATPGRENQGGPRIKRCNAHPDALLVKRTDVTLACSECGEVIEKTVSKQTIDPNRQIVGSGDTPADVADSVLISTKSAVRDGFHEARARHFEVDEDPAPNLQPVGSAPSDLCRDCGLRLFSVEEQASGRHNYACTAPARSHRSTQSFAAVGGDD